MGQNDDDGGEREGLAMKKQKAEVSIEWMVGSGMMQHNIYRLQDSHFREVFLHF